MVQVVSSDDDEVVKVTRTKVKEGKKKSQVRDEQIPTRALLWTCYPEPWSTRDIDCFAAIPARGQRLK